MRHTRAGLLRDHVSDGLRRDYVGHHVVGKDGPVGRGVEQLWRDGVHPDPVRAELDIEKTGQVGESGLARAVCGHAAGWLDSWTGGYVHDGT
jgi:hypothetical protein